MFEGVVWLVRSVLMQCLEGDRNLDRKVRRKNYVDRKVRRKKNLDWQAKIDRNIDRNI